MADHPRACAHCGATFIDPNGLWMHTKAKHGRKAAKAVRPPRDDGEPSMADELVKAIQSARAGERVPEHLVTMFPEHFPRGTKVMPLSEYATLREVRHG